MSNENTENLKPIKIINHGSFTEEELLESQNITKEEFVQYQDEIIRIVKMSELISETDIKKLLTQKNIKLSSDVFMFAMFVLSNSKKIINIDGTNCRLYNKPDDDNFKQQHN